MNCLLEILLACFDPIDLIVYVVESDAAEESKYMAAHKAYIAHHIPGHRIRIRVPHKKRDAAFFHEVAHRLNSIDGIKAEAAPETGSVLVHYQGNFTQLLMQVAETGLSSMLELEMGDEPVAPLGDRLIEQAGAIEQKLLATTGGHVDGRTAVLLTLLLTTGVQLFRGRLLNAVPLLWYTAETVRHYMPNRRTDAS